MGQKVNPIGLRLGINRNWESRWFPTKANLVENIGEDYKIRLFFVEYLINTFQCDVGSGILILEMDVGELYDFKFTVFIEA